MNRKKYLFHQTFLKIRYQKRGYFLYVFSFYIGLLLPAFCIANMRFLDKTAYFSKFDGMEQCIQIEWFGQDFYAVELGKEKKYSISSIFQEEMEKWDHQYVTIQGIDGSYFFPVPNIRGRYFKEREFETGEFVCLLGQEYVDKYHCRIGEKLTIQDQAFEIIGTVKGATGKEFFIPYKTMAKLYEQSEDTVQFRGIFFGETKADQEKLQSDVTGQIENSDAKAEILGITDGTSLVKSAERTRTEWKILRSAVAVVAIVFFLLNEIIVLENKMKKERKTMGINLAMGATQKDIKISFLMETLIITCIALFLIGITLEPLTKVSGLKNRIVLDGRGMGELLVLSVIICIVLTLIVIRNTEKEEIASLLKMRDS